MAQRVIESILVVDDDAAVLRSARRVLSESRRVAVAGDAVAALDEAMIQTFDVALVDVYLGCGDAGFGIVRDLRRVQPQAHIVMMSGFFCAQNTRAAFRVGAHDCVEKPVVWGQIIRDLERGAPLDREAPELPTIEDIEANYYATILAAHHGNISAAARALQIRRTSLQRILARSRRTESSPTLRITCASDSESIG